MGEEEEIENDDNFHGVSQQTTSQNGEVKDLHHDDHNSYFTNSLPLGQNGNNSNGPNLTDGIHLQRPPSHSITPGTGSQTRSKESGGFGIEDNDEHNDHQEGADQ